MNLAFEWTQIIPMNGLKLPPISTLVGGMQIFQLPDDSPAPVEKEDTVKPTPFTVQEDLAILKCIRMYYGSSFPFDRKVPWNFWNVYRRTTGSWRTNSSLYHHWVGSICKKYSMFLDHGQLNECIEFVETEIRVRQGERIVPRPTAPAAPRTQTQRAISSSVPAAHAPQPLYRNRSTPPQIVSWPYVLPPPGM